MDVLGTEQPANSKLRIEAFSDLVGEDAKNVVLSQHRAAMVKAAIRTALPDIPLEALGLGPDQTKFPDQAASQANAMRRRADILIARNFAVEPDAGLVASVEENLSDFSSSDPKLGAMFRTVIPAVPLPQRGLIELWFAPDAAMLAQSDETIAGATPTDTRFSSACSTPRGRALRWAWNRAASSSSGGRRTRRRGFRVRCQAAG